MRAALMLFMVIGLAGCSGDVIPSPTQVPTPTASATLAPVVGTTATVGTLVAALEGADHDCGLDPSGAVCYPTGGGSAIVVLADVPEGDGPVVSGTELVIGVVGGASSTPELVALVAATLGVPVDSGSWSDGLGFTYNLVRD